VHGAVHGEPGDPSASALSRLLISRRAKPCRERDFYLKLVNGAYADELSQPITPADLTSGDPARREQVRAEEDEQRRRLPDAIARALRDVLGRDQ